MKTINKHMITLLLTISIVFSLTSVTSAVTAPAPVVFMDGMRMEFEVPPAIINGSTLVPLRAIFEGLGAHIEWNETTRTVTAVKGDITVIYTIGQTTAKRNQETLTLATPGQIVDSRTLVPLRFVSEALGTVVGWEPRSRSVTISSYTKVKTVVTRVLDGDTIEINVGGTTEKLRLIGIDTPETVHPDKPVQEGGKEASDYTKAQLVEKTVYVEYDVGQRDQYGRLLGYLYLESGVMFNATLIAEGYAILSTYPPNVHWVDLFTYLQADARAADRGLWADDGVEGSILTGTNGKLSIVSVDKIAETVVIQNNDLKDINMTGWLLVSVTGNQKYSFPDGYVLKVGAKVVVTSGMNATEGSFTLNWTTANIWNNSTEDPAELYDMNGKIVSTFK